MTPNQGDLISNYSSLIYVMKLDQRGMFGGAGIKNGGNDRTEGGRDLGSGA